MLPQELLTDDAIYNLNRISPTLFPIKNGNLIDAKAREIRLRYGAALAKLYDNSYLMVERETWFLQLKEADEWLKDNTVTTPLLTALATHRGVALHDLVDKIKTNDTSFRVAVGTLLGQQQAELDVLYQS